MEHAHVEKSVIIESRKIV